MIGIRYLGTFTLAIENIVRYVKIVAVNSMFSLVWLLVVSRNSGLSSRRIAIGVDNALGNIFR